MEAEPRGRAGGRVLVQELTLLPVEARLVLGVVAAVLELHARSRPAGDAPDARRGRDRDRHGRRQRGRRRGGGGRGGRKAAATVHGHAAAASPAAATIDEGGKEPPPEPDGSRAGGLGPLREPEPPGEGEGRAASEDSPSPLSLKGPRGTRRGWRAPGAVGDPESGGDWRLEGDGTAEGAGLFLKLCLGSPSCAQVPPSCLFHFPLPETAAASARARPARGLVGKGLAGAAGVAPRGHSRADR